MSLDHLIERLHGEGRLRVWSIAVTVFGDAIAPRGGSVAMADLSLILERLGAEPGAIRTAMSRLARDGFVERHKEGRRSYYRLAPDASADFQAAAGRIYAAHPTEWSGTWTVALGPEPKTTPTGFLRIAPSAWIAPGDAPPPPEMFTITGGSGAPPDWARDLLSPPELSEKYAALSASWRDFNADRMEGLDAVAARTLLIHQWRRILLRDAPLPRALRPANWAGADARDLVADIYRRLLPASEAWLSGATASPGIRLPVPEASFDTRFNA